MHPIAATPRVEVPATSVVAQLVVTKPVVAQPSISVEEQNMLYRFLRLAPPRFFGEPSEDTYEFSIAYEDNIYNFGLVETRSVDYSTFLLDLADRHWWICYHDSWTTRFSHLMWTQFFEKYMTDSLSD